jgi:hypothetical protein
MNMAYYYGGCSGMADWLRGRIAKSDGAATGLTEADVMETITSGKNAVLFGPQAPIAMAGMMGRENRCPVASQHLCGAARKNIVDKQLIGANPMFSPSDDTEIYKRISKHA